MDIARRDIFETMTLSFSRDSSYVRSMTKLPEVERIAKGKPVEPELVRLTRRMTTAAIQPIDDIRSTARYRSAVAGNLVAEFIEQLEQPRSSGKTV